VTAFIALAGGFSRAYILLHGWFNGLANIRDMRKLGRLGTKAIVYFEVVSTLGLAPT